MIEYIDLNMDFIRVIPIIVMFLVVLILGLKINDWIERRFGDGKSGKKTETNGYMP